MGVDARTQGHNVYSSYPKSCAVARPGPRGTAAFTRVHLRATENIPRGLEFNTRPVSGETSFEDHV